MNVVKKSTFPIDTDFWKPVSKKIMREQLNLPKGVPLLLFGAFDAFQVRLQTEVGAVLPSQVFLMAPYVLSIIALVIVARRAEYPRALLKPWFKGAR